MQPWARSSFCGGVGDACIEVRRVESIVYVRDSKYIPDDSVCTKIHFTTKVWLSFILSLSISEPAPTSEWT
ncbi:DUF397 domain-containing protein [Streptomyces sp. NPDC091217]|uniref:DUF397 domain-containing protein n=1 Tax=Streptomyces sp. NPDC091217 TaxID=3365975 RepID=UPI00381248A8